MPKVHSNKTTYICDGPQCEVTTQSYVFLRDNWLRARLAKSRGLTYYHRIECAIAHMSQISNGFDAAVIKARIGEPRPAGSTWNAGECTP